MIKEIYIVMENKEKNATTAAEAVTVEKDSKKDETKKDEPAKTEKQ